MYLGVITAIVPSGLSAGAIDYVEFLVEAILFTVIPSISFLTAHLAYTFGSKDKKIFAFLSNKK